jgi:hypothetical protein
LPVLIGINLGFTGADGAGIGTKSIFQIEIVPADGIRLPVGRSGDLGTSPFFGSSQSRQIRLTATQCTILNV